MSVFWKMSLDEMWMEYRKSPSDITMGKLKLAYAPLKDRIIKYARKEIRRGFRSGDPVIVSALDSSYASAFEKYLGRSHAEFTDYAFQFMFKSVDEHYRRSQGRKRINLFVQYRRTKDPATLHSLVEASKPFVMAIVCRIKKSARSEPMEDLVQDGIVGLMEVLKNSETRNWDSFMRSARKNMEDRINEGVLERSNMLGGHGRKVYNVSNTVLEESQKRT